MAAADRLLAAGATPERLSLRAVAREAGVAAPSVYLQFESKDALIDAVVAGRFQQLGHEVAERISREQAPAARLLAGCQAYLQFAEEHPSAYQLIFETRTPVLDPDDLAGQDVFQMLVDGVFACLPADRATSPCAFAIATDIWVAMHGMVTLRRTLPAFAWPSTNDQLERIVMSRLPQPR